MPAGICLFVGYKNYTLKIIIPKSEGEDKENEMKKVFRNMCITPWGYLVTYGTTQKRFEDSTRLYSRSIGGILKRTKKAYLRRG